MLETADESTDDSKPKAPIEGVTLLENQLEKWVAEMIVADQGEHTDVFDGLSLENITSIYDTIEQTYEERVITRSPQNQQRLNRA